MRRILDNKKLLITVISLLIVVIGGTYAWISSRLDATRMVLTLGSDDGITVTLNPYKLEMTLAPVESYTNGKYVDVEANNQDSVEQPFYLYYEIKNISEALQSSDFQFKVMKSTDNGETWIEDTIGDFSSASTEEVLDIYEDTVPANTRYIYRVYLWIQEENEDQSGLQGTTFDGNLLARFDDNTTPKVLPLDSTMIPVKIANNGTVTAISKYDPTWYDYETKQWANAVITTSTNRSTYLEVANGTRESMTIPAGEILAYYVWIPRYKYAFPNHDGSPETIDIVFETKDTSKSAGTGEGTSYYTHPAFTFGNEELPGFWIGKFEISGGSNSMNCTAASTCTHGDNLRILPNATARRSNTVRSFYYAIASMAKENNTFGISTGNGVDSHMIKNDEWGAVAYLSHSIYGINSEIRLNNSTAYLTGCGASAADATGSATCGITYGSVTTYPQSTTGNITGVFDMAGGAVEYTVSNYNNVMKSSGFSSLPTDSKYYNLYTIAAVTNCTQAICGGHALYETSGWYNDRTTWFTADTPWAIRGGAQDNGAGSGIFSYEAKDGNGGEFRGSRAILIVNPVEDTTKPVCSFAHFNSATIGIDDTTTIDLTCTDTDSGIDDYTLKSSDILITNSRASVTNITKTAVTDGYKYTITVKGVSAGTDTLKLKANVISNNFNLKNDQVISETLTVKNTVNISSATITLSQNSYTYDGTAKEPEVTVTLNGHTLTEDTDYTVAYSNNINVGNNATVTVSGINDFSGSKNATFAIIYNAFNITLDNDNATTNGTATIYMRYADGVYLNSTYTNKMTTNNNHITIPQRTGYAFGGYYDGSTKLIDENGYITSAFTNARYSETTTLNAHWSQVYTYTVNFNANGGTGAPSALTNTTENTSHTFTLPSTYPTKEGTAGFLGWSVNSTASTLDYPATITTAPELTLTNDSSHPWTQVNGGYKSSTQGIQSSTTNLTYNFTLETAGTLSFKWSVSSESTSYDYLYYTIYQNGSSTAMTGIGGIGESKIGGTSFGSTDAGMNYLTVTKDLTAGTYRLVFTYKKDSSVDTGLDAGFVKEVSVSVSNPGASYSSGVTLTSANPTKTLYAKYKESLANATITLSQDTYEYDGTAKTPTPTVTLNGVTLAQGTDYTVAYSNNTEIGTATVTVTGIGNYGGTKNKTFSIVNYTYVDKPTAAEYCKDDLGYTGSAITLTNNPATGYTFSNNTRTELGTQTVTATLSVGYRWTGGDSEPATFDCTVVKGTPVITLSANSGGVTINDTLTFTEQANANGTFTVTSNDTSIATVTQASNGVITKDTNNQVTVTGVGGGETTITITFTPSDTTHYNNAVSKTYAVTVGAAAIKPTAANYCETLTFDGTEQTLTKEAGVGYTFTNNTRTNAGNQTVTAVLDTGYIWSDKTTDDVAFNCTINKYTPSLTVSTNTGTVTSGNTNSFTATVDTEEYCLGTLTAVSADTTKVAIVENDSKNLGVDDINTAISITYQGGKYGSNINIGVNYVPSNINNCNTATQKQVSVTVTDDSAPTGSLNLSNDDTSVTATINATDVGSDITRYYYKISEATGSDTCDSETTGFTDTANSAYTFPSVALNNTYFVCTKTTDEFNHTLYLSDTIVVEKKAYLRNLSYIREYYSYGDYYKSSTYRYKIRKIEVTNYIDLTNAVNSWDLTDDGTNKIRGWLVPNTVDATNYDLYIGSNYSIYSRNGNLANAFAYLRYVTDVNLDKLHMREETNASRMFHSTGENSTSLNIDLGGNFDTRNLRNTAGMFLITGLNTSTFSLNLGNNFDTSNVIDMSAMFSRAGENATTWNLNLGNHFDTRNVTTMYHMFYGYGGRLSNVVLNFGNNFDTSNVTNMAAMFSNVGSSATTLTLELPESFNAINVVDMNRMFEAVGTNVTNFTLNLGNQFYTNNVVNMVDMFAHAGANATTWSINLGNHFNTINVTNMYDMFLDAGGKSTDLNLDLGEHFNTTNVRTMSGMFENVGSNVSSFHLDFDDNFDTSNVTSMSWMFTNAGYSATDWSINLGNSFNTSNVTSMSWMFASAGRNATNWSLNLGDHFNTTNVRTMSGMFNYIGYTAANWSLDLGNHFDTGNVTNMSYMFAYAGMNAIDWKLDLGNYFNTIKAQDMAGMFLYAGYKSDPDWSLNLGNHFNTINVTNMSRMFSSAGYKATNWSLNLGNNFNTSNVTDMGGGSTTPQGYLSGHFTPNGMFADAGYNAVNWNLNLGNQFDTSNVKNMSTMFANVGYRSTNFNLNLGNNFNTINVINMAYMFYHTGYNATNWQLNLGNNFNTSNVNSMPWMFYYTGYNASPFYLDLGNQFDMGNVSYALSMFNGTASNARNFTFLIGNNGFNFSSMRNMDYMFSRFAYNADDFNLHMGDNVNASSLVSMNSAFYYIGGNAVNFYLNLGNNFNISNAINSSSAFSGAGSYSKNFTLDLGNNFNASNAVTMYGMFMNAGTNATNWSLNLGNNFNTSNGLSMYGMFANAGRNATNFSLNLGDNFNTSKVTSMTNMFYAVGYHSNNWHLDLGNNFDTSNLQYMTNMFAAAGWSTKNFSLNLGNHFNTSNVTDMVDAFAAIGHSATTWNLNLGNNFNTSNVTSMINMFSNAGYNAFDFSLNLGNQFNTYKVKYMLNMFRNVAVNSKNINLNLGNHFNTSNVINMSHMFSAFGFYVTNNFILNLAAANFNNVNYYADTFNNFSYNYGTIYVGDVDAQDWIISKNRDWGTNFDIYNVLIDNINYILDGGSFEEKPVYSMKGRTEAYTLPHPVKTGYIFTGWTGSNGNVPQVDVTLPVGTTEIVRYFAHWTENIYSITYDLDGGTLAEPKNTYTSNEAFTIGMPYKAGYIFTGWTGSNGEEIQISVTIPSGSIGNLSYVAHYRQTTSVAEESLAKLHKLGGTGAISTITGTTSGTCFEYDDTTGDMIIRSVDKATGRLCESIDNYGETLVFRGNVDNNYVKFGNWGTGSNVSSSLRGKDMYWRIVRINGDGSLRLVYDGTIPHSNSDSSAKGIEDIQYSAANNDNAYIGYMYGDLDYVSTSSTYTQGETATIYYSQDKPIYNPLNNNYVLTNAVALTGNTLTTDYVDYYTLNKSGATTTNTTYYKVTAVAENGTSKTVSYDQYGRKSNSLAQAQANINDSTVKRYIDDWYLNKTDLNSLTSNISDAIFCNNRSISTYASSDYNKGFGTNATYYSWYYSPWSADATRKEANFICSVKNDAFTVSDTINGNGALTYPVGMLTIDDVIAAGGYNSSNTSFYLYNGYYNFYTLSPSRYNQIRCAGSSGYATDNCNINTRYYVRPVINLKVDSLLSGRGTIDQPFVSTAIADTIYTINYTLNSGSITGQRTTYTTGDTPFSIPNPTRTGYTFTGWTGSNGTKPETGLVVLAGTHQNLSYSANWQANEYSVTLNSGTEATTTGTTQTIAVYGASMRPIDTPTRTNYAFVGYYTGENGTGNNYYSYQGRSVKTWNIANDATLYAYWKSNVITFDNDGATVSGTTSLIATLNSYLPSITIPQKTDYEFYGYYTGTNCSGTRYINSNGVGVTTWNSSSPTTYYACWVEPETGDEKWGNNSYPFSGSSSSVNNYVTYNGEYWRIIGVFDGRMKIIRNYTYINGVYSSDNSSNAWTDSYAKSYLNSAYYNTLSDEAKSMISPYNFKVGACSAAVTAAEARECIATATDSSIVGLMDIADYGMSSANCKGGAQPVSNYTTTTCRNSSWLVTDEWTITPDKDATTNALRKSSSNVVTADVTVNTYYRPVVYLNENVYIVGGKGTSSEPYLLKVINDNRDRTLHVGDYVSYTPSSTNYNIDSSVSGYTTESESINPSELNLWRVIKKNRNGTVDLISEYVSSDWVSFGGKTGYQNYTSYLNTIASQYETSGITVGSRHYGYGGQTGTLDMSMMTGTVPWTCDTGASGCSAVEAQGGGDTLYQTDYNKVVSILGTAIAYNVSDGTTAESYYIPSRKYDFDTGTYYYTYGYEVNTSGNVVTSAPTIFFYYGNGQYMEGTDSIGVISAHIRPIVTLKAGMTYTGAGTKANPWVIAS